VVAGDQSCRESKLQIFFGWVTPSIGDLIRANVTVFSELPFVVVTAIDSSQTVSSMPWVSALSLQESWEGPGGSFVVSGFDIVELAVGRNIFFGFDEIRIPHSVSNLSTAEAISLRCPLNLGEEEIPLDIAAWVARSEIRLVLGDGYGTNFVGSDQGLLTKLGLQSDMRSIVVDASRSTKQ
jgi:hypothetical protein